MKFIGKFGFIALSLTLGACSTKQAPPPPPLTLVTKAVPPPEPEPAPLTGAQLLAQQPQEVQEAVKQHQQDGAWQVYKTPRRELYPYDEGQEPAVDCAPLRTTDIQLEPGETITDVASGDSERWLVTPASSGDPRNPDSAPCDQTYRGGHQHQSDDLHHEAHLPPDAALARRTRNSGSRLLLS